MVLQDDLEAQHLGKTSEQVVSELTATGPKNKKPPEDLCK